MVFLHILRSLQFYIQGRVAHAMMKSHETARLRIGVQPAAIDGAPAFLADCLCISRDVLVPVYIGLRLIDGFGHMNNASYLEAFEFARWYHFSYTRLDRRMWHAAVYPVVSGVNIQYLREIKPFQTVHCRVRGPFVGDDRTMIVLQQLESKDGKTIYATATIQIASLNLPFRRPATKEAAQLAVTKKGAIPVEELMSRLYYTQAERKAASVFLENNEQEEEGSIPISESPENINSVFGADAVRTVTRASLAWRSDAIKRSKAIRTAAASSTTASTQ